MSPVAPPPSARERIGGRWAISGWLYGITAALALLVSALSGLGATFLTIAPVHAWWSPLFQVAAVWLVIWVADLTVFRNRATHPVPVWWVCALGAVGGLARSAVQVGIAAGSGEAVPAVGPLVAYVIAVVVTTGLLAPIVAYLRATREWYAAERERITVLEAEAEAQRLRATGALEATRDMALAAAMTDVEVAQAEARRVLDAPAADPTEVAGALLTAARAGVRPASHALVGGRDERRRPRVSARGVARNALAMHPLPILIPVLVVVPSVAPRLVSTYGWISALIGAVTVVVSTIAVFLPGRRAIRRVPAWALPITVVACLLAFVPNGIVFGLAHSGGRPGLGVLAGSMILFLAVLITSMVATAEDAARVVLEEMREPVRRAEVEARAAERARDELLREVGLHLHTSVQSGLVAASYAIQDAVERGDADALEQAISSARDALDRRLDPSATRLRPGDAIAQVAGEWAGIVEVRWEPDPPPAGIDDRRVVEVIREGLANAVVHGHATNVTIRMAPDGADVVVEIEDDGAGPGDGAPGLGTAVLQEATTGRWQLTAAPHGGALLRATVALAG